MKNRQILTLDFETDPFLFGRIPEPFACGIASSDETVIFWGDSDRIKTHARKWLESQPPSIIYAHNGGKFDFFFLLDWMTGPMRVVNGRIIEASIFGGHVLRDSYAILPIPLSAHDKGTIDYALFERDTREFHKDEIIEYLARDCESLLELVTAFVERFGPRLTIGGTAMRELRKLHPQEFGDAKHDAIFRPWYYGGRVECFDRGILKGNWHVYDVNSLYPAVMRDFRHPRGIRYFRPIPLRIGADGNLAGIPNTVYFARVQCYSDGALPMRDSSGLHFPRRRGEFFATCHELREGLRLGIIRDVKPIEILACCDSQDFGDYVNARMEEKLAAEISGDKTGRLFAKLLANSAYGKFGTNCDKHKTWEIIRMKDFDPSTHNLYSDSGELGFITSPPKRLNYYDVAIAASITGAARAVLMRAIHTASRVVYCDTDSIICEGPGNCIELDPMKIGAWKTEANGDMVAIGGKKLYALSQNGAPVKMASKGANLSYTDIVTAASGGTVTDTRAAPSFSVATPSGRFISRSIKATK